MRLNHLGRCIGIHVAFPVKLAAERVRKPRFRSLRNPIADFVIVSPEPRCVDFGHIVIHHAKYSLCLLTDLSWRVHGQARTSAFSGCVGYDSHEHAHEHV